jgi:hypothetical protein
MVVGILETRDVLVAANELALVVVKHVKDGAQLSDIPAVITDLLASDAFKAALVEAIKNIQAVPGEIADIDLSESIELVKAQIAYVPKIIEALKA